MAENRYEPYSSLKPYAGLFRTGFPILMYHKLGPRPRRVRLKGLYVGTHLFRRQIRELREGGFESVALTDPVPLPSAERSPIALTFDDGFQNVLQYGVEPLREYGFRSIQFLVADRLGERNDWDLLQGEAPCRLMDEMEVREWLAAGQWIGSHTLTHPWLTRLSGEVAREEISASKKKLEDKFGRAIEHFCYPYGDWNDQMRELVAEAGYRTACITEGGINTRETDVFALKRFTARYPSRNLKAIWRRVTRRVAQP